MPDVNVYEAFKELIQRLLAGDEEVAELAASDPEGVLAAYGVTEADLTDVDFRQAVADCYGDYELSDGTRYALDNYVAGGGAPAHYEVREPPAYAGGAQPVDQAVQHLQYVTYAAYEHNEAITTQVVNRQLLIDNSDNRIFEVDNRTEVSVDVAGDFDGDLGVAPVNATAAGDGAVANTGDDNVIGSGEGDVIAASRGGEVTAATGDGAVAGGRDVVANTGENSGLLADGDVRNAIIGDENQTANLDIDASGGAGGDASGTGGAGGLGGFGGDGGQSGDGGRGGFGGDAGDGGDAGRFGGGSGGFGGSGGSGGSGGASGDASGGAAGGGAGGTGTGGDASGGAGGTVGPINLNFGSGDQATTDIGGNVDNSAVAGTGPADNVADNRVDDGSALATGRGDATGNQEFVADSFNDTVVEEPPGEEFAEEVVITPLPEPALPQLEPADEVAGA